MLGLAESARVREMCEREEAAAAGGAGGGGRELSFGSFVSCLHADENACMFDYSELARC